jgi:hypothetical protein
MARSETVISVFVASPSDVLEERKALESIAQELNKTWSKNLNLRIDLIKWETDIYPGFGRYSQDVINEQINDDYDVFIAIFWSKIGSPTLMAASGTLEEFERAYKKYHEDKDSLDIMIYFKDQAISPSKMDFEQLQKINELKQQLGEKGGLYWTFEDTEEFESLLRGHLSKIAQKWSSKLTSKNVLRCENTSIVEKNKFMDEVELITEEDEYGLLDYMEMYEDRMFDMGAALSAMTDAIEKIGAQFNKRTEEINSLIEDQDKTEAKQARKVIKLTSDDLERYSEIIESQIKITSKSRMEAFDALSKALSISVDFKNDDDSSNLLELEEKMVELKGVTSTIQEDLSKFRNTMSMLPRLTIHLNKSKRRAVKATDAILEEVKIVEQSSNNVLSLIGELKKQ